MNWLTAWKKMLLFGLAGALGCLAGWAIGELFLAVALKADPATGQDASLVSRPTPPPVEAPPEDFRQRLEAAGAQTGDVQLSLIWDNTNDLDLHCVDPQGFEIYYSQRRSPSGGVLDVDRNAACNQVVKDPVENIYWPAGGAPNGNYRVYVNYFQRCPGANDETPYKVNILVGSQRQQFSGTITRADGKKLIHEFGLKPSLEVFAPSTVKLVPGKTKVPFVVRRSLFKGP